MYRLSFSVLVRVQGLESSLVQFKVQGCSVESSVKGSGVRVEGLGFGVEG